MQFKSEVCWKNVKYCLSCNWQFVCNGTEIFDNKCLFQLLITKLEYSSSLPIITNWKKIPICNLFWKLIFKKEIINFVNDLKLKPKTLYSLQSNPDQYVSQNLSHSQLVSSSITILSVHTTNHSHFSQRYHSVLQTIYIIMYLILMTIIGIYLKI